MEVRRFRAPRRGRGSGEPQPG